MFFTVVYILNQGWVRDRPHCSFIRSICPSLQKKRGEGQSMFNTFFFSLLQSHNKFRYPCHYPCSHSALLTP